MQQLEAVEQAALVPTWQNCRFVLDTSLKSHQCKIWLLVSYHVDVLVES